MTGQNFLLNLKLIFIPSEANNFRPKFLTSRVLIWCLVILFFLKLSIVPFLICFPKITFFSDISKTALVKLLNQDRQEAGLPPLNQNSTLDSAAVLKAQDMLAKDYFAHQSPEGLTPWYFLKQAGYNYNMAGENLAIGFLDSSEVEQAWLASPSHKANLLNPDYKEVGMAVVRGEFEKNETTIVVQLLGAQKLSTQSASATPTPPKIQTKSQEKQEQATLTEAGTEQKEEESAKQTLSAEFNSLKEKVGPTLKETQEKAAFNLLSFFSSDFYKVLQIVIYGFLILIIIALLINIFVRLDIQHSDLILKALGFITVLIIFVLIDKSDIIRMIPHNFNIY